ncbi:hypothetical protein NX059_004242 [Plenodomus lindquistii]|nr:hypothetical protein NX059_004242 [Plenodomus lindquistii]
MTPTEFLQVSGHFEAGRAPGLDLDALHVKDVMSDATKHSQSVDIAPDDSFLVIMFRTQEKA